MQSKDIAGMIDHSLLQPFLTDADIRAGCAIAIKYHTASVCCRPTDLPIVTPLLKGTGVRVSTVIGFPHGSNDTRVKVFEAGIAMDQGAVELDMVLNIGKLKSGEADYVKGDIRAVCEAAHSRGAIVKVILENCYLTDDEKRLACGLAEAAGADFVKTSTGYGTSGAVDADLILMRKSVSPNVRIKAAGGVRTLDAALRVRGLGCSRFDATATIAIMEEAMKREAEGTLG